MGENVKDSSSSPPWMELPLDLTANILQRLGAEEILQSAQFVCKTWLKVCLEPTMWRVVDLESSPWSIAIGYYIMCRCAVDRSQGQLIELRISYFGNDGLLDYIVDRASNIKCLSLQRCFAITGIHLTQAIKKLPDFEEMHLMNMSSVNDVDVRAIGLNCPQLRSFSYNGRRRFVQRRCVLAISKSMPNLRRLVLVAQGIRDTEVEAILDGCPHLEYLDINQDFDFELREDL